MRLLTLELIFKLHRRALQDSGGDAGIRDRGAIESAHAQPEMSFGGQDLYPTLPEKAASLGFSLIKNHAFVDGNKRVGHAAIELFLLFNGYELVCDVDLQEATIFSVASGEMSREEFTAWVQQHTKPHVGS